jgi:hypothetical protein
MLNIKHTHPRILVRTKGQGNQQGKNTLKKKIFSKIRQIVSVIYTVFIIQDLIFEYKWYVYTRIEDKNT